MARLPDDEVNNFDSDMYYDDNHFGVDTTSLIAMPDHDPDTMNGMDDYDYDNDNDNDNNNNNNNNNNKNNKNNNKNNNNNINDNGNDNNDIDNNNYNHHYNSNKNNINNNNNNNNSNNNSKNNNNNNNNNNNQSRYHHTNEEDRDFLMGSQHLLKQEKREAAPGPPSPNSQGYLSMNNLQRHNQIHPSKRLSNGPRTPSSDEDRGSNRFDVNGPDVAFMLEQMIEMGYTKTKAQQALEETGGISIDLALVWLDEHQDGYDNQEENKPFLSTSVNYENENYNNDNNDKQHSRIQPDLLMNTENSKVVKDLQQESYNNINQKHDDHQNYYEEIENKDEMFGDQSNTNEHSSELSQLNTEDIKMIIVVRADLNMPSNKVVQQCCHGVAGILLHMVSSVENGSVRDVPNELFYDKGDGQKESITITREQGMLANNLKLVIDLWKTHNETKVILKCDSEKQLLEIRDKASAFNIPTYLVSDFEKNDLESGIKTVVVLGPYLASIIDRVTGSLTFY